MRRAKTGRTTLAQIASSKMRSQWTRAWLLGPLATSEFEDDEDQFASAVFANDFSLLKKALVWFQAEKTVPNPQVLAQSLPLEQRLRFADFLGWPSDFATWSRFISFLLRRISDIPVRLYPAVVAIFEVWQNALAGMRNAVSQAILTQCAEWLRDLQTPSSTEEPEARVGTLGADRGSRRVRKIIVAADFESVDGRADLCRGIPRASDRFGAYTREGIREYRRVFTDARAIATNFAGRADSQTPDGRTP